LSQGREFHASKAKEGKMGKGKPLDQDQADENAMKPMDAAIDAIQLLGGGQLVASIVNELLDCWRHLPKPYADATEGQQQDVFRRFEGLAKTLVEQIAERIAAGGENSVVCVLGDAKVGSDIKCDLKLAPLDTNEKRDAAILFLAHARGRRIVVKLASADQYDEEPAKDPSQPDQADLGFEAGSDTVEVEEPEAEPVE
jgi:hypothetical protein